MAPLVSIVSAYNRIQPVHVYSAIILIEFSGTCSVHGVWSMHRTCVFSATQSHGTELPCCLVETEELAVYVSENWTLAVFLYIVMCAKYCKIIIYFFPCRSIDLTDDILEKELGDRADLDYGKELLNCCNGKATGSPSLPKSKQSYRLEKQTCSGTNEQWNLERIVFPVYAVYKHVLVFQNIAICNCNFYSRCYPSYNLVMWTRLSRTHHLLLKLISCEVFSKFNSVEQCCKTEIAFNFVKIFSLSLRSPSNNTRREDPWWPQQSRRSFSGGCDWNW